MHLSLECIQSAWCLADHNSPLLSSEWRPISHCVSRPADPTAWAPHAIIGGSLSSFAPPRPYLAFRLCYMSELFSPPPRKLHSRSGGQSILFYFVVARTNLSHVLSVSYKKVHHIFGRYGIVVVGGGSIMTAEKR